MPSPFFTDIFPGIFFLQNFHISIFWQCVRYSFKSRPFNCDPFSCPGPQRRAACFGQRADWQLCCVVCSAPGLGVLLLCWARRWTRPATLFCSAVCRGLQETQAEHCHVVCRHCAAGGGKNVTALTTKKYPAFYLGEKRWIYENLQNCAKEFFCRVRRDESCLRQVRETIGDRFLLSWTVSESARNGSVQLIQRQILQAQKTTKLRFVLFFKKR